jgi:hypothetical protein
MMRFLDCLVSYFGLDEDDQPTYRQYFCYHVVAGPGPTPGAGVASITTLAVRDDSQRCTYCRAFHTAEAGGPAAALAEAVRYLDTYHHEDRLRKVQSEIRGLPGDRAAEGTLSPDTLIRTSRGRGDDRPEGTAVEPIPHRR